MADVENKLKNLHLRRLVKDKPESSSAGQKPVVIKPAPKSGPKASDRYSELNNVQCSLSHKVETWDDTKVSTVMTYDVKQVTDEEAVTLGQAVLIRLSDGQVDIDVVNMMLRLAVSLRKPDKPAEFLMDIPTQQFGTKTLIMKKYVIATTGGEVTDAEQQLKDRFNRKLKGGDPAKALASASRQLPSEFQNTFSTIAKESQAAAYCFIAAYLMRLQCKQADNTVLSLEKMKNRYASIYEDGADVVESLTLDIAAANQIRDIIARRPELISTWVMWVAYNENEKALTRQESGLLTYIACQLFAYQGMHVLTQVLDLQRETHCDMGDLLKSMKCNLTKEATDEIYLIIRDYEITDRAPDRKTYFRYARVWSTGYFTRVQSKNCVGLLYLVAKTMKQISSSATSDPTKIFAVQKIGASLKDKLDDVSAKLVDKLMSSAIQDDDTGDIWY